MTDLIEGLHHTAVCVSDFQAAKRFYTEFLGFEVEAEMLGRSEEALGKVVGLPGALVDWAMLRRPEQRLELFTYHRPERRRGPGRQCDLGYTHIAMQVTSVDKAYELAIAQGYKTISEPQELRGGRTKVFYLLGPDTIIVEFIEFREEKARHD